jgi:hypothetical protein
MAAIQSYRVSAQQPMHALDQVGIRGFDDQVKMVAHQTIGMHPPIGLLARFGQGLEEILPVHVVPIDVPAPVPAAHHMVDGPGKIDTHLPWHGWLVSGHGPSLKK